MKFLHTADWHIGKKFFGFDLLEDQAHAFKEMVQIAEEEQVDAIVIAGDLYDRTVPAAEAVELFNQMMYELNIEKKFPVLAITGNHDSHVRVETGSPWFKEMGFYLHTRLDQAFEPIEIGGVQFFLLPYFEPFQARQYFQDESIRTIEDAMQLVVKKMAEKMKSNCQQVLVAHFFVAGSQTTDSETKVNVGGLDNVPVSLLSDFDYVALGHLHTKNALQAENARYSGTLLKYSLSERNQEKGVWIVEMAPHEVNYHFRSIEPLREVEQVEGAFSELMENQEKNLDYVAVCLTDAEIIPNAMAQLRTVFPHIFQLERKRSSEKRRTSLSSLTLEHDQLDPLQLFERYFEMQKEHPLSDQQKEWAQKIFSELKEEEQ